MAMLLVSGVTGLVTLGDETPADPATDAEAATSQVATFGVEYTYSVESSDDGDYIYQITESDLVVWDNTDKSNPTKIDTISTSGDTKDAVTGPNDNYLYIIGTQSGSEMAVYDITDPTSISKVGSVESEGSTIEIINDDYVVSGGYYSYNAEVYDVTDPSNPTVIYEYDTNKQVSSVSVSPDTTRVAFIGTNSQLLLDTSNPANPKKLDESNYSNYGGTDGATAFLNNDEIYHVGDGDNGEVYYTDISDDTLGNAQATGIQASSTESATVYRAGSYHIHTGSSYEKYDVSDPLNPSLEESAIVDGSGGDGIAVYSGHVTLGSYTSPHLETWAVDGVEFGSPVTGDVELQDGTRVDGANVTLKQNGSVLETATTNATGEFEFSTVSDGTYNITATAETFRDTTKQVTVSGETDAGTFTLFPADAPSLNNASPSGGTFVDSSSTQLSIDYNDPENTDGTVTFYLYNKTSDKFEPVDTVTGVSDGGTATTTVSGLEGQVTWYAEAENGLGTNFSSSNFEFQVAGTLEVRQSVDTTSNLDSVQINATISSTETAFQTTRSTNDGVFELTNLPDEQLKIELGADGYENRSLIISSPSGEYVTTMIQDTQDSYTQSFELSDQSGEYPPEETRVVLQTVIDGEYRDTASDSFGVTNQADVQLVDDATYRVKIVNSDGDVRQLNEFAADNESVGQRVVTLTVESLGLDLSPDATYGFDASIKYDNPDDPRNSTGTIDISYEDKGEVSQDLRVGIYERGNQSNEIYSTRIRGDANSFSTTVGITNNQTDKTWVVEYSVDRNGETKSGKEQLSLLRRFTDFGAPESVTTLLAGLFVLLVSGLFSNFNATVGGSVATASASIFWLLGWFTFTPAILTLAAAISVTYYMARRSGV